MKIAVLAGGFGTRLGALTRELPKPMIEVGGRPFLEWVVDAFAARGLRQFVFLVGYRADAIASHFGDGKDLGVTIQYSHESEPLGTGGALREARALLGARFLVTYGDVLRRFDYDRFVAQHQEPCLAVYPRLYVGNTEIEDGRVTRFDKNMPTLPYIDAGFSVVDRRIFDLLPSEGACSYESVVFPKLASERALAYEIVNHDFYDIGTPEELARTKKALEG